MMMNGLLIVMTPLSPQQVQRRSQHAVATHPHPGSWATIGRWPKIPDSTKASLHQRLTERARQRWPQLTEIRLRYRAGFAYVDGVLADGEVLRLCRLRYAGSARDWGFAIYRASHDDYEDSFLPTGSMGGPAEDALDTACGLYLGRPHRLDLNPRRTYDRDH